MVSKNCQQIEELILKQINEEHKELETELINKHIENCSSCRAFKLSLTKIEKSMQIDADTPLQPNPAIQETIINQMQPKYFLRKNWLWNIISAVKSVFEYRIPVYQASLAMIVIIFLITFSLDYTRPTQDRYESSSVVIQNAGLHLNSEYMNDNYPDFKDQKVGVNVREDSILIGFIYTPM